MSNQKSGYAVATGPLPNHLANAISDVIHQGLRAGLEVDEACSVVLGVVGDYWHAQYGEPDEEAIAGLSGILKTRAPRA